MKRKPSRSLTPEQWEERKEAVRDEVDEFITYWQRRHPDSFPNMLSAAAVFPHYTEDERAVADETWQERMAEWHPSRNPSFEDEIDETITALLTRFEAEGSERFPPLWHVETELAPRKLTHKERTVAAKVWKQRRAEWKATRGSS